MFAIEVLVYSNGKGVWKKMRPTNGEPYIFQTYDQALNTVNVCYPFCTEEEVKIVEITAS